MKVLIRLEDDNTCGLGWRWEPRNKADFERLDREIWIIDSDKELDKLLARCAKDFERYYLKKPSWRCRAVALAEDPDLGPEDWWEEVGEKELWK